MHPKVGVIGVGKMGDVILRGLLRSGHPPRDVLVTDLVSERAEVAEQETGAVRVESFSRLARECDVLFICVQPGQFHVLGEEAGTFRPNACLVSIMAGVPIDVIKKTMKGHQRVIRAMPNVACLVNGGVTALCRSKEVSEEQYAFIYKAFDQLGGAVEVTEDKMDAVTALSGSGPAFYFLMMEAMIDAGVLVGLDRATAAKFAVQTAEGSARMALETRQTPYDLIARVTSPGGTTIHGLAALEEAGFKGAVMRAVKAACDRAAALKPDAGK